MYIIFRFLNIWHHTSHLTSTYALDLWYCLENPVAHLIHYIGWKTPANSPWIIALSNIDGPKGVKKDYNSSIISFLHSLKHFSFSKSTYYIFFIINLSDSTVPLELSFIGVWSLVLVHPWTHLCCTWWLDAIAIAQFVVMGWNRFINIIITSNDLTVPVPYWQSNIKARGETVNV